MNYEKKLALAKEALESGSYDKETIEYIFPKLKESEDEKIRKDIISFLKEGKPYHCPNSVKRQEWAAWLEKQCEPQWKPGDIHLEALRCAINGNNLDVIALKDLLEQLKKL